MGFISKKIATISQAMLRCMSKNRRCGRWVSRCPLVEGAPPEGDRIRIVKCGQRAEILDDETEEDQRRGFRVIHNEFYEK